MYGTVPRTRFESRGLYFGGGTAGVTGLDHNLHYHDDSAQTTAYVDGNSYQTDEWSEYRSFTSWDAHSFNQQLPLFVDPVNNYFQLRPGSPAIDTGVDVGLPFNGAAPDIGAFETE